jgi:hypothetical protein
MTGGGAQDNYGGAGNLLTASFPQSSDTWEARGKDHEIVDLSSLTVYAIGIRPSHGGPLPRARIFSATSPVQAHPLAAVTIPSSQGFVLTSGGALADYHGAGSLLTGSYPDESGRRWLATAKDHDISDPAALTVWAIGLATSP